MVIYLISLLLLAISCKCAELSYSYPNVFNPMPPVLISVQVRGSVGSEVITTVDRDDVPLSSVEAQLSGFRSAPESYWPRKVREQLKLSNYRLVNRMGGQLPLPPTQVWNITVIPDSGRLVLNGKARKLFVVFDYEIESMIIARRGSIEAAEKSLVDEGGVYSEEHILPLDPSFLFQKTGFACIDETFTLVSEQVNSLNYWNYFNETCQAGDDDQCHKYHIAEKSCQEAMVNECGIAKVNFTWTRVAFDQDLFDKYRVAPDQFEARDLLNVPFTAAKMFYKYVPEDDCSIAMGCALRSGWRKFLTFPTVALNVGAARFLQIGRLGKGGARYDFIKNQTFIYDKCLKTFRLNKFASYSIDNGPSHDAIAICVRDMWRLHNHEYSPLATPYTDCDFQGISSGWAYVLESGASCQSLDITDIDDSVTINSILNPNDYICEGFLDHKTVNDRKKPLFTNITETQDSESPIPGCALTNPSVKNNNYFSFPRQTKTTFTTEKCPISSRPYSEFRDCGWTVVEEALKCQPGLKHSVTMKITPNQFRPITHLALRVCESISQLGNISSRCDYNSALHHSIVTADGRETKVTFMCPEARDGNEKGGMFSIMAGKYVTWELLEETLPDITIIN